MPRPAQRLFLELIRTPTTDAAAQAAKVNPATLGALGPGDWRHLWRLIARSGLPGYFLSTLTHLQRAHRLRLPAALMHHLEDHANAAIYSYLVHRKVYDDISRALARDGIAHLPLKGIRLIDALYPDPGWRTLGDIDVLLDEADLDRAHETLLALGLTPESAPARERMERYSHHHGYTRTVGEDAIRLELHFRLGAWIPKDSATAALRPSASGAMDPQDELLYLMLHAGHHLYRASPKWHVDVHLMARTLAPSSADASAWDDLGGLFDRMQEAAREASCLRSLHLARAMHESFLSLRIPAPPALPATMAAARALCRPDELLSEEPVFVRKWPYYALAVLSQDDPVGAAAAAARSVAFKVDLERRGGR